MKLPDRQQLEQFVMQLPLMQSLIHWTKNHSLPGFFKVPLFDVAVFVFNEIRRFDLMLRANAIAFSFFLALFPAILVIFTLVPFLSEYILSFFGFTTEQFLYILQNQIRQVLPGDKGVGAQLFSTIEELATRQRVDILSIGFVLAMFFASNGMLSMMHSFEKSHLKSFKKRPGWRKRMIAILLTIQLGLLMIASVILIILGNYILEFLSTFIISAGFSANGIYLLRWIAIILVMYVGIGVIYRYGMSTHIKFSIFSPGATLATILSILTSVIFSYYVNNFGAYDRIYGPIGAIIVLMLWIQLNALVLLIGFELNASIAVHRDLKLEVIEEP